MTEYSWTGISRTSGLKKKLPFQNFSGIHNLIYEIIKKADCRWTDTMNIKLFKDKILKHAGKIEELYEKNKRKKVVDRNSTLVVSKQIISVTTDMNTSTTEDNDVDV